MRKMNVVKSMKILKQIDTYPSHEFVLRNDFIDTLIRITENQNKIRDVNPEDISNDLIVHDTMPTLDCYIRLERRDARCARVVIINRVHSDKSNICSGSVSIIGAVIFDYGNVFPMMYFGIDKDSNKIEVIDDLCFYKFESITKITKARTEKHMPTKDDVIKILRCWYGIEFVMLQRERSEMYQRFNEMFQRSRLFTSTDCVDQWPNPLKYKDSYKKDGTPRTYRPKTAVWHKKGFNKYNKATKKIEFVQQVYCARKGGKKISDIRLVLSPWEDTYNDFIKGDEDE